VQIPEKFDIIKYKAENNWKNW